MKIGHEYVELRPMTFKERTHLLSFPEMKKFKPKDWKARKKYIKACGKLHRRMKREKAKKKELKKVLREEMRVLKSQKHTLRHAKFAAKRAGNLVALANIESNLTSLTRQIQNLQIELAEL